VYHGIFLCAKQFFSICRFKKVKVIGSFFFPFEILDGIPLFWLSFSVFGFHNCNSVDCSGFCQEDHTSKVSRYPGEYRNQLLYVLSLQK
jgi:hypothetical protein